MHNSECDKRIRRQQYWSEEGDTRGCSEELTPYSVGQCHGHVALISDTRSYSVYCAHNTSHKSSTQFATLQRNTLYNYAANSSLSSQEIPLILWNPTVRYSSSQQYYSTPRTNVTGLPPQSSPIIHTIHCKTVRNPKTKATGTCRSSNNKLGNARNNSALCLPRCNDLAKR